jgi:hypothetical protein
MLWSKVHDTFLEEHGGNLKGVEVLYVISQYHNKKPFKVGITGGDIYRRMSNFQTAFIDFNIYYLIAVPNLQVKQLENKIHTDNRLKRIKFPKKRPNQKIQYSEWIDNKLTDIVKVLHEHALNSDTIYYQTIMGMGFNPTQNI